MNRESDILARMLEGSISLPPARLRPLEAEPAGMGGVCADAIIEASWEGQAARFSVQVNTLATPKALRQTIALARETATPPETYPMLVVPYLSPAKLDELAAAEVSGIDLCGNGVLIVPGRMLIFRSGKPNKYPQSTKIRNVYRGKNSLVARAFLIQPEFTQVKDIVDLLEQRGGRVAFSTVSKALKRLEEDLVVSREGGPIRLLQADVLLGKLVANYDPPIIQEYYCGKCDLPVNEIIRKLSSTTLNQKQKVAMTGAASAEKYAAMAREPVASVYSSIPPGKLLEASGTIAQESRRFANLEILQTTDARAFFDPRDEDGLPFASPVQTYLELATGDKRQKDAAEQVRQSILASVSMV